MQTSRVGTILGVAAALALGTTACGSSGADDGGDSDDAAVSVVASTDVWGDVAEQVAGDLAGSTVSVTSLIDDPAADPHSYEASTQNLLALSKADLVIENGGGYDDFVDTMLGSADNDSATVLNAVDLSGRAAGDGGEVNEHVWYDVPTVRTVAARIAEALGAADPGDRATFQANLARFDAALQSLEDTEAAIRAAHDGEGVAITEPVPLYLLEACGLEDRTPAAFSEAIENGTDVPVSVLKQTEDLFTEHEVELLVYNEQTTGAETDAVLDAARTADVPVVPVTETLPAHQTYQSWMRANLAAVQEALG